MYSEASGWARCASNQDPGVLLTKAVKALHVIIEGSGCAPYSETWENLQEASCFPSMFVRQIWGFPCVALSESFKGKPRKTPEIPWWAETHRFAM